jgi:hypothetical protein
VGVGAGIAGGDGVGTDGAGGIGATARAPMMKAALEATT